MDSEKKRTMFFGSLIALVIFSAVVYFFWGNLINRGTLILNGPAPFSLEFSDGGFFACEASPCRVPQKIGAKDFIVKKEGYVSAFYTAQVRLFRETAVDIRFELVPYVEKLSSDKSFPVVSPHEEFSLVKDETGKQSLIKNSSPDKVLAYFLKPLTSYQIYGNSRAVFIVERERASYVVYRIDTFGGERKKFPDFGQTEILDGKVSPNGQFFLFSLKNSVRLSVLDSEGDTIQTPLSNDLESVAWLPDSRLLTVSNSANNYLLGIYDPHTNKVTKIAQTILPEGIHSISPVNNGGAVYFKSGEQSYRLVLGKI